MAETPKRNYNITALQRGLRLLQLFTESAQGLTAKHVAGRSRLPVSTVHRFLANLGRCWVSELWWGRGVPPGNCMFRARPVGLAQLDNSPVSLPYLQELNRETPRNLHLTVRSGLSAVYVEKLDSPEPLRIHSRIGAFVPLYLHGGRQGHAGLHGYDERQKVLPELGLKRLTPTPWEASSSWKPNYFGCERTATPAI